MSKNPIRAFFLVAFAIVWSLPAAPLAGAQELLVGQVAALTNPPKASPGGWRPISATSTSTAASADIRSSS